MENSDLLFLPIQPPDDDRRPISVFVAVQILGSASPYWVNPAADPSRWGKTGEAAYRKARRTVLKALRSGSLVAYIDPADDGAFIAVPSCYWQLDELADLRLDYPLVDDNAEWIPRRFLHQPIFMMAEAVQSIGLEDKRDDPIAGHGSHNSVQPDEWREALRQVVEAGLGQEAAFRAIQQRYLGRRPPSRLQIRTLYKQLRAEMGEEIRRGRPRKAQAGSVAQPKKRRIRRRISQSV